MLTKNEVKDIQSLYQKKQREQEGLFIAEGPKMVAEIIGSDYKIKNIYATAKWLQRNAEVQHSSIEITEAELSRISQLQTPNEVLIVAKQKVLHDEPTIKNNLTIVLDGIQDPGNMGTIIRTADWFGLTQIICSNDCVDIYNPKVVQATMGSIVRVSCWYKDLNEFYFPEDVAIYGALLEGENIYSIEKITEGVLIIGSEAKGISEVIKTKVSHPVTIPKYGKAESLNAAVAAGIIIGKMVYG